MVQITRVLLGLLIFTLPFDQAFSVPFVGSLSRALGLTVAFVGLLTVVSDRTIKLRRPSLFLICAGLFVGWNVLSVAWGIDRVASATQSFTYVQLWVMVWLIWNFIDSSAHAHQLRRAYMLGTWVTVGTILWNYANLNTSIDPARFSAFDANVNYTGLSIVLAIPMAFDAAVHDRSWWRLMAILLIPAGLYAIPLTASRSSVMLLAVTIVLCVLFVIRSRPAVKVLLLTVMAGVAVTFFATLPERTARRISTTFSEVESADFSGRGWIWDGGLQAWLNRPALGAGAGNFDLAVLPTLGAARSAHNSFLALLVELGPIGSVLFLLLFLVAAWPYLALLTGRPPPASRRYIALHTVLLIALLMAQLPATWQYQRVTWFLLVAATLDRTVFLAAARPVGQLGAPHGA